MELIKGNKLKKEYSLDEIRNTAIDMHNFLREIKVTEAHKPIFIAGILIALNDEDFSKSYSSLTSYKLEEFWVLNQYIAMFIITVIKANKYRFGYGRKWTLEKMKDTMIKLPCNADGTPDFEYMEQYIKALPYSDKI